MNKLIVLLVVAFSLLAIIGEILCVIKFVKSDFKPSYTREIVYGVGMVTGTGCIIGWLNIEDSINNIGAK